jgi:hypothetical protein
MGLGSIGDALGDVGDAFKDIVSSPVGTIIGYALGGPVGAMAAGAIGGGLSGGGLSGMAAGALGGYGVGTMGSSMGIPSLVSPANAAANAATGAASWGVNPRHAYGSPMDAMVMPTVGDVGASNIGLYSTPEILNHDVWTTPTVPTTSASQATLETAAEKPFWESDWMKYGTGIALLAGMFEDPDYDIIDPPSPEPSVVSQAYGGELAAAPASRRHTFGSKRSALNRRS